MKIGSELKYVLLWKITKQLCACLAVYKLLTALLPLELAESEIPKHMRFMQYQFRMLKPFNDHRSQLIGSSLFCYNSPAAAPREVFKPSPDSASLVVSSQKKNFQFWVRGSLGWSSQVGVFCVFMAYFDWPWTPIEWAHIFDQTFLWN